MANWFCLRFFLVWLGLGLLSACANQSHTYAANTDTANADEQPLKGATPQTLNSVFGPPLLRHQDGPAQVWLYQSSTCDLDVFLYRDASGISRVTAIVPDNGANLHSCLLGLEQPVTAAALERNAAS